MPLARHDEAPERDTALPEQFLLTCLLRGMTGYSDADIAYILISTHMPLARHDGMDLHAAEVQPAFLLTCLLRGMTLGRTWHGILSSNFYSHASCEA